MKFSIVTVCYNVVDKIEATINSVINQSYDNIEYIIIDGCSNDGTIDVVKKYSKRINHIVCEKDNGVYDAMNKGISLASGDYINFMNAGDVFFDVNVLQNINRLLLTRPSVMFGDMAVLKFGQLSVVHAEPFYEHLPFHHTMGFNHQASFVRVDVAKSVMFDLTYKLAADYKMMIDIYRAGGDFFYIENLVIAIYEGGGLSEKKNIKHTYEKIRIDNPNKPYMNYLKLIYIITCMYIKIIGRKILNFLKLLF